MSSQMQFGVNIFNDNFCYVAQDPSPLHKWRYKWIYGDIVY